MADMTKAEIEAIRARAEAILTPSPQAPAIIELGRQHPGYEKWVSEQAASINRSIQDASRLATYALDVREACFYEDGQGMRHCRLCWEEHGEPIWFWPKDGEKHGDDCALQGGE